ETARDSRLSAGARSPLTPLAIRSPTTIAFTAISPNLQARLGTAYCACGLPLLPWEVREMHLGIVGAPAAGVEIVERFKKNGQKRRRRRFRRHALAEPRWRASFARR